MPVPITNFSGKSHIFSLMSICPVPSFLTRSGMLCLDFYLVLFSSLQEFSTLPPVIFFTKFSDKINGPHLVCHLNLLLLFTNPKRDTFLLSSVKTLFHLRQGFFTLSACNCHPGNHKHVFQFQFIWSAT